MKTRDAARAALLITVTSVVSACANGRGAASPYGPADGPLCEVRLDSDFSMPIEAGARAGGREIELGTMKPGQTREFEVPCSSRAVTVYRVVRSGSYGVNQVGTQARALAKDEVTEVTLRPRR